MKKFLAFLLALTMLLGVGALAEEDAPLFQQDVMVLFTSDVHCGIEQQLRLRRSGHGKGRVQKRRLSCAAGGQRRLHSGRTGRDHDHRRGEHQADERRGLRYRHHGQP